MMTEQVFRNKITYLSFALMVSVVYIHAYNVGIYGLDASSGVYWLETYIYFSAGSLCSVFLYDFRISLFPQF